MSRPQRLAQYIRDLAYQSLVEPEEKDVRPDDAPPRAPESNSNYGAWSAANYSVYVPFRAPANH